jgi:hypothetical protein
VELRHAWEQALPRALGEAAFARPVVAAVGAVPATAPGPNPSCAEES